MIISGTMYFWKNVLYKYKKGVRPVKEQYTKPVIEVEELNKADVLMESIGGPDVGPSDTKLTRRENFYISFFDLH